ncbi:dimethylargininase [Spelaeicoccus albus]|uniref:Dimethylargininase n=1 Tax=Spelaeicoccus albus TaxID=1280376 RepID=A0A7Z0D581_9MICO|nr:dimethylargininase [Spelaeicoccus albus]NYI69068.1 dimethylargininase [Spelaeicoccus albus]
MSIRAALVRKPVERLDEGVAEDAVPVDVARAEEQWTEYVDAVKGAGYEIIEVPASPDHPDSVFVEDTVVVYKHHAVIANAGHPTRRGEQDGTKSVLADRGYEISEISHPATLDGGDVLKIGDTIYVGHSGRTNAEGVSQLRAALTPAGATVVGVPVSKVLHLKSAVTALPDGTVIGYEPNVDQPGLFPQFLALPEPHGSAVVVLSDDTVLMSTSGPENVQTVRSLGWNVVTVNISELEKLDGCVTCLSVRLRDLPA